LYYLALCEMNKQNYDQALRYFYRSDEVSREIDKNDQSGFMVLANLRIGMIYDLQKKRQYAQGQYQKVLNMKKFENSHELANKYLKTPHTQ